LAKMTALAAAPLGVEVVVLEKVPNSPALGVVAEVLDGNWDDSVWLRNLAGKVDCVTIENEFVDILSLEYIEELGVELHPGSACLRLIQDKFEQKRSLQRQGLPVAAFAAVESVGELMEFGAAQGWPVVLKRRRNAYDGKGNRTVSGPGEAQKEWDSLHGGRGSLYVEQFCPFTKELAVIVTRGRDGEALSYPVAESVQQAHVCRQVIVPARVPTAIIRAAERIALKAVGSVGGVGSFGVELFLLKEGTVLVNELAPRVHNSGHYSIEGCVCSQFENHVRAVLGLPLGSTALRSPAVAMVNLLGEGRGTGKPQGLAEALAVSGAHVHVYGKRLSGPSRKMGHVTALGVNQEEALLTATRAAALLHFAGGV